MFKKDEPIGPVAASTTVRRVEVGQVNSIIGRTLFIKGELTSDEEVLIEGKIEGKLKINHRVVVGKSGVVNADIEAKEVIIKGAVNGNVKCSYKVEIVPEGVLTGNIVSYRVVLAEGAVFKGNIDMTSEEGVISADPKEEAAAGEVAAAAEEEKPEEVQEVKKEEPQKEDSEEKKPEKKKK
ncbi:MAG: polymer-forming cytoskeletal protein [Candidatus Aminicenantes bacterium]|nr:polymer-forming cytoskeletal protein [Candidatus Aminicenantes bacterium]